MKDLTADEKKQINGGMILELIGLRFIQAVFLICWNNFNYLTANFYKNGNKNVIREMKASELNDVNGGLLVEAIIITGILLLIPQKAY